MRPRGARWAAGEGRAPTVRRQHARDEGAHRLQRRLLPHRPWPERDRRKIPAGRCSATSRFGRTVVADGDWWRLITPRSSTPACSTSRSTCSRCGGSAGRWRRAIGHWRYLTIYCVSGLAGSVGALLAEPQAVTVGASGAIFGCWARWSSSSGRRPDRSPGLPHADPRQPRDHRSPCRTSPGRAPGGLVGGELATLALTHFGTRHVAYARVTPVAVVSLIAIMVGSVVIAYWRVRGLA